MVLAEVVSDKPASISNGPSHVNHGSTIRTAKGLYPQGCSYSPDGLCILTTVEKELHLIAEAPSNQQQPDDGAAAASVWQPVLKCNGGDTVRSYQWYPFMDSSNPATCCFVSSSRDQPVHLWDAYNGGIRATYRPYNGLDEMESPSVICFSPTAQHLWTGGFRSDRMLHLFDLSRPGRTSTCVRLGKTRKSKDGQKGIVSAMAVPSLSSSSLSPNLLAVGTYSPGSIYLYDDRATRSEVGSMVLYNHDGPRSASTCLVGHGKSHGKRKRKRKWKAPADDDADNDDSENDDANDNNSNDAADDILMSFSKAKSQWYQSRTRMGVTQLSFSNGSNNQQPLLYSTSRRSNAIVAWDLRNTGSPVQSYEICNGATNQRIEFDISGDKLYAGGTDGCVREYDLATNEGAMVRKVADTAINGISVRPNSSTGTSATIAVACGCRQFPTEQDWDDADEVATDTLHDKLLQRQTGYVQILSSEATEDAN